MSFLVAQDISRFFLNKVALKNVSLTLDSGHILQVKGENGAGKSTLLRILAGLDAADRGEVRIRELKLSEPISFQKIKRDYGIGYCGSNSQLYAHLTIKENLQLAALLNDVEDELASSDLKFRDFKLESYLENLPSECSTGIVKKASLYRALVRQPKLLILDEPFVNLDHGFLDFFVECLKNIAKSGTAIIIACHEQTLITDLNPIIIELDRGMICGA